MRRHTLAALLPTAVLLAGVAAAAPPRAIDRDLRDYAISACLTKQATSPYLREQGYALGSILMERTHGAITAWRSVDVAVTALLSRQPALTVHVDGPVNASDRPAPLAQCLAILDAPPVRAAMARLAR